MNILEQAKANPLYRQTYNVQCVIANAAYNLIGKNRHDIIAEGMSPVSLEVRRHDETPYRTLFSVCYGHEELHVESLPNRGMVFPFAYMNKETGKLLLTSDDEAEQRDLMTAAEAFALRLNRDFPGVFVPQSCLCLEKSSEFVASEEQQKEPTS